jgi:hypothetical protein
MTKAIELSQLGNVLTVAEGTGNVGIRESSPSYEFHVKGSGTVAYFEGSGGNSFIGLEDSDDSTIGFIGVDGGSLKFQTSGSSYSDKLVITSGGNVLIGKSASSGLNAGCEFRPDGLGLFTRTSANAVQVRRLTDDGDFVEFYQDAGLIGSVGVDGTSLTIGMAGATKLRITSDGKVLINDASLGNSRTDAPLQIETGSSGNCLNLRTRSSDDVYSYINFQNNAATQTAAEIYLARNASNNAGNLVFGTANANSSTPQQRMMISSGGATTLHVNSASHETFRFTTQGVNEAKLMMKDAGNNVDVQLNTAGDSWFNGGDVGIGTNNPTRTLSVSGSVNIQSGERIESYSSGGNLIIQGGSTYPGGHIKMWGGTGDDMITFNTSGASASSTERLRITSAGQVMIGHDELISHPNMDDLQIGDANGNRGLTICSGTGAFGSVCFGDSADGSGTDRYEGYIEYYHNDNSMRLGTSHSPRLTITSGGYVNIGGNFSQSAYTAQVTRIGGNTDVMQIKGNSSNSFIRFTDSDATSDYSLGADDAQGNGFILYDRNAGAYRLIVTNAGRVGVNDDTNGWAENFQVTANTSHNQYGIAIKIQNNSGYLMRFAVGNAAPCGSISGGSGNSTSFNTSWSDSRRKKNFETWNEEVLPHFKSLEPKKFNFTQEDDGTVKTKGYVAQDNVDKFPEAYPSLDDSEVDEKRYMFNPSGMVIYLMKALQEEIAKREALESRIAALEN